MGLEQEFNSLDAQWESCAAYIERQGWQLVAERYDDGGFTGANTDRPAFQRLMMDVEAGQVDVVVCYKVDRLSRSLLDFAKMMELLNQAGASFVSVTQNFSTADAMGRMTLGLLMTFAQFEREMTAERTRDKVLAARRKGRWTGGFTPLGYSLESGKLVINEREAVTVREAFNLLFELRRPAEVARQLNERGLYPPGRRLAAGKQPRWDGNAVTKLLRSPLYAGRIRAGTDVAQGEHAPLVAPEVFERAQAILDSAHTERKAHGRNPAYLLRGLLRCGVCGAALTPASTRKKKNEHRYYVCNTRNKDSRACTGSHLPAPALERQVVERLRQTSVDAGLVDDVRQSLAHRIESRRATLDALRRTLPGHIANLQASSSRLADDLNAANGRAREVILKKLNVEGDILARAETQLAEARREWAELDGLVTDAAWVADTLTDFGQIWDVLTTGNKGRLLRALIDHVVVNEAAGQLEIHLVDFTSGTSTSEAA
jgi:DNA invertase Pin-like site-specific DNA recombinase